MNKCQIRPCRAPSCPARLELIYPPAGSSNGAKRTQLFIQQTEKSSGPGEFHPQALSDPDVRLSPHPALMIQSPVEFQSAIERTDSDLVAPHDPASELRWWSDVSTACISGTPT